MPPHQSGLWGERYNAHVLYRTGLDRKDPILSLMISFDRSGTGSHSLLP